MSTITYRHGRANGSQGTTAFVDDPAQVGDLTVISITSKGTDITCMPWSVISGAGYPIWSADGQYFFHSLTSGTLNVWRTSNWTLVKSIPLGGSVMGPPFLVEDGYVYVPVQGASKIVVLTPDNWSVVTTITTNVGGIHRGIFSSDKSKYYFTNYSGGTNYLRRLDTTTNTVAAINVTQPGYYYYERARPAVSSDDAYVYVWSPEHGVLDVVRTSDFTIVDTVTTATADGQCQMEVTPDDAYVYMANDLGYVEVLETAGNTIYGTIPRSVTSTGECCLLMLPDLGVCWHAYRLGVAPYTGYIDVIRLSDQAVIGTITGSEGASAAYGGMTRSPDGTKVFTSTGNVIDIATGDITLGVIHPVGSALFAGQDLIPFSPDGTLLSSLVDDNGSYITRLSDYQDLDDLSDWNFVTRTTGSGMSQSIFTRVGTGSLYLRADMSSSAVFVANAVAFYNASTFEPYSTNYGGQANAASYSVTAPALGTFPITDGVDVAFFATNDGTYEATFTLPANYSPANVIDSSWGWDYYGSTGGVSAILGYRLLSGVTTVGSIVATNALSFPNIGFHVLIESARFRMYLDAWLMTWSGWSSTWSNTVVAGGSGTFTLNAQIKKTIESSFTANAIVRKTITPTFTLDAIVRKTFTPTFIVDAVVRKTMAPTGFTLDAILRKTQTGTAFTLDAWLQYPTRTGSFTVNSIVRETMTPTGFKLDAWVAGSGFGGFDAYAILRKTQAGTITLDAILWKAQTGTSWTLDAIVRRTQTPTAWSADAVIRKSQAGPAWTLDALLLWHSGTISFTLDANIFGTVTKTFALDAEIIGGSVTGDFHLDATIDWVVPGSFTLDAWAVRKVTGSFTLDALILRTWTFGLGESFEDDFNRTAPQWDGFGNAWTTWNHATAADGAHGYIRDDNWWDELGNPTIPQPRNVGVYIDFYTPHVNPDLWFQLLIEVGQLGFWVAPSDWWLTSPYTVQVGLYGNVNENFTELEVDEETWYSIHAWSVDGHQYLNLWKASDPEPTDDFSLEYVQLLNSTPFYMALEGTVEGEYFLIDNLRVQGLLDYPGITLDAELYFTGGAATIDAVIQKAQRGKFNLYALIARNAFTLDAELAPGGAFSIDALIVGPRSSSFRLDAWIFNGTTRVYGWHADAVIKRTATGTFTANAILERVITTAESSFLAEAVCLDVSSGVLTLDAHIIDRHKAGSFTVNADIKGQSEKRGTLTLDAMVKIIGSSKFNLDATITQVAPFHIDAWLAGAITLDAEIVSGVHARVFFLDAEIVSRGFTLDALLQPGGLFTVNATLRSVGGSWTPTGHFHLDAVVRKPDMVPPVPIWLNAWIVAPSGTKTFTLDAWVGGGFQIDAWIEGNGGNLYGGAFPVDAYIKGNVTIVWPEDGGPPVNSEGNPWPDWFRASRKYRIKITVGGTDITGDVVWSRTSFTQNAKTNPGTFEIVLDGTSAFDGGEEVLVEIDDFRTFGGYVLSVERSYVFDSDTDPQTVLRGADYNILFDKLIVYNKDSATGSSGGYKTWKSFKKGTYDDTIIKKVMSSYVDLPEGLDYTTYVDRVGVAALEVPFTMPTPGVPLRQVMQSLSQVTTSVWWIDPYLHVHNHSRSTISAPYPITDGYGGITGRAMSVSTDISQMVNEDIVWGTLARTVEGEVVAYHKTDDESIAEHGRWQFAEFRSDLHHTAYIDRRSDSILERYKDPIYRAKIVVFEPGYQAGQGVEVISTTHDLSKVLIIRSMTLQMAVIKERDGSAYYGVPRYELSIGLDPENPWDIYDYLPWPDDHDVPWHSPWVRCQDCNDVVCDCSTVDTFDRLEPIGWGVSEIDDIPWVTTSIQQFHVDLDGAQFAGYDQFQEAQLSLPAATVPFEVLATLSIPAGGAGYVTSVALEGGGYFYADLSREAGGTLELYAFAYDDYLLDQTVGGLLDGFDADTPIRIRLRVETNVLRIRLWFRGDEEPEAWTAEIEFPVAWTSYAPEHLVLRFGNLDVPITYQRIGLTDGYVCGGKWVGIGELKQKFGVSYLPLSAHVDDPDYFQPGGYGIRVNMDMQHDPWKVGSYANTIYPGWFRASTDIDSGIEYYGYEDKSWISISPSVIRAKVDINDPRRSGYIDDPYAEGLLTFPTTTPPIEVGLYYPQAQPPGTLGNLATTTHNLIGDYRPFAIVQSGTWFSIPVGGLMISPDTSNQANISTSMPPTGHGYGGLIGPIIWPQHSFSWKNSIGSSYSNPSEPEPFILTIEYYEGGMVWATPDEDDCADIEGEVFGAVTEGWGCETLKVKNGIFYTTGKVTRNTLTVYDADTGEFLHPTSDWTDNDHDGKDFTVLHAGTKRVIACYRNYVENVLSKYATPRVTTASRMRVMPV